MRRVGVLALQGDVPEHLQAVALADPDARGVRVRTADDLETIDALLMPGGESTTIDRLLREANLERHLTERARAGMPVLATCAGLILAARAVEASPGGRDPRPLGLLDVSVRRNDYGRQRESFEGPVRIEGLDGPPFPGVFIRAPKIVTVGDEARKFAFQGDQVVGVRQGSVWGLTFHPELTQDPRLLRHFLQPS